MLRYCHAICTSAWKLTLHDEEQFGGTLELEGPPAGQQTLPEGGIGDDLLLQGGLAPSICLHSTSYDGNFMSSCREEPLL